MFTDFTQLSARSEHRRQDLLADAANYRLARLARAARRARHTVKPATDPPEQPTGRDPAPEGSGRCVAGQRALPTVSRQAQTGRHEPLTQAENFRLVELARTGSPPGTSAEGEPAHRNDAAERRCAVSR